MKIGSDGSTGNLGHAPILTLFADPRGSYRSSCGNLRSTFSLGPNTNPNTNLISVPDVRRVPAEYKIRVKKHEQINRRITLLTSGAFLWERVPTVPESRQSHVLAHRSSRQWTAYSSILANYFPHSNVEYTRCDIPGIFHFRFPCF